MLRRDPLGKGVEMELPKMIRIRQIFDDRYLEDIPGEIAAQMSRLNLAKTIDTGQTVALACSGRGVADYGPIVQSVVSNLKHLGLKPFLVPSMGSHGSATAEGQKHVLESYGVTEEFTGAPIRSSLEVVHIGETEDDIPVFLDKQAHEADYIIPINHIRRHTDFEHEIESGLLKLMVIGLGNQKGAETYHQAMFEYGYPHVILTVARAILQKMNILCGVGVVENPYAKTTSIHILLPEEFEEKEKELLKVSKKLTPGLPFEDVDILVIDEMGKDIIGSGFDTKVVGRIGLPLFSKEPETPRVKRIVVCDLTAKSDGNAAGIGNADLVTQRLVDKMDVEATNINCLSSCDPEGGKIPITMPNDRTLIEMAIQCVGMLPPDKVKVVRILNTLHLSEVEVSEAYKEEILSRDDLKIIEEARPMTFDLEDNLKPFYR
jgi:hypothetical protein